MPAIRRGVAHAISYTPCALDYEAQGERESVTRTKDALRKSLAVATMAIVLAGAGAGAAWAGTPTQAPTPPPVGPTHPGATVGHPVSPPRPVPVVDSGRVVMVNPQTMSVHGYDGRTSVFQLSPHAVFVENGRSVLVGRLAPQDRVQVTGVRVGKVETANRVVDSGR